MVNDKIGHCERMHNPPDLELSVVLQERKVIQEIQLLVENPELVFPEHSDVILLFKDSKVAVRYALDCGFPWFVINERKFSKG